MNGKLTVEVVQRVVPGLALAAALGAVGFATSRASDEDVKANSVKIVEIETEVNQRLTRVETNVVKTCQFLDRQDKLNGGPGLDCQDPR